MVNGYSHITVNQDVVPEHLTAEFNPNYRNGMRTKQGRRRLQRFINRLQGMLNYFEERYG